MIRKITVMLVILALCLLARSGADEEPQRVMNFLAVMDLKCGSGIAKDQCAAFTDVLIDEMVKMKKYTVIDRANRDKILSEAGFQQTGCVDNSCTIEMGWQLGVGKMVVGSVAKLEENYIVNLQLLNVETSAVEASARETCEKCKLNDLITTVSNVAHKLMGEKIVHPPTSPEQQKFIDTRKIADSGLFPTYQEGKAMVIFYRPSSPFAQSTTSRFKIYEGSKIIGQFPKGHSSYFYYETEPGLHDFSARGPGGSQIYGPGITLIAGKTIFIKFYLEGMIFSAQPPDVGLIEAKKCKFSPPEEGK